MEKRASREGQMQQLHHFDATMRDVLLCGLGQTAPGTILRAIDKGLPWHE